MADVFVGQDSQGNAMYFGTTMMTTIPQLPATAGTVWHVKPSSGDDDSNNGLTPDEAFATLAKALAEATAGQNDIVILHAESNTAASTTDYQSATLDWNKDMVHLIGANSGPRVAQRSRVAFASDYATASNLFTLSANGCLIQNVHFFEGVTSALPTGCMKVTGQRNVIRNCHIAGIGADTNDIANAYSLWLYGAAENLFDNCAIGLDTIGAGTAANREIYVSGAATRNAFQDCLIFRLLDHTSNHPLVELADATSIDRWLWFKRCGFLSLSVNYAIAQSGAMKLPVLTQGYVIADQCWANSADNSSTVKWDAADRNKIVLINTAPIPAGDTAGTERMV